MCFPRQTLLIAKTGLSNGTVNTALRELEERGYVQRHRSVDEQHRKRPTQYDLLFDAIAKAAAKARSTSGTPETAPTPKKGTVHQQSTGDGANSKSAAVPSPAQTENQLQPTGDKPVNKSKNNLRGHAPAHDGAREAAPASQPSLDDRARFWAKPIRDGKHVASSAISVSLAGRMLELGLVKPDQLRSAGISH